MTADETKPRGADKEQIRPPLSTRLQIVDLLALALCVGFVSALKSPEWRDMVATAEVGAERWPWLLLDFVKFQTYGLAIFGALVLTRRRIRDNQSAMSPGHWLFVAISPFAYAMLVIAAWREIILESTHVYPKRFEDLLFGAVFAVSLLATLRGLKAIETHWRACFASLCVWQFACCCWHGYEFCQSTDHHILDYEFVWITTWLVSALAAVVALLIDAFRRVSRDWLHWAAVLMFGALAVSFTAHRWLASAWQAILRYVGA